jgi:hypothetical protein
MSDLKNDRTQAERRAVLKNDRAPTTYHQLAGVDQALEGGGRFGKVEYISGSEPSSQYPRLPALSPWSGSGDVGLEPPTGVAIDAMEAVGTPAEVSASLSQFAEPAGPVAPAKRAKR